MPQKARTLNLHLIYVSLKIYSSGWPLVEVRIMGKKATVLATACAMILVAVFFQFYIFRTPIEQTPSDVFFLNGFPYTHETTPYGRVSVSYYVLLPNADSYPYIAFPDGTVFYPGGSVTFPEGSTMYENDTVKYPNGTVISFSAIINPYGTKIRAWGWMENVGNIKGMLWDGTEFYLLSPDEPLPPNAWLIRHLFFAGPMQPPDPLDQVMIDNWIYSQIPTNFTEFTMPQLDRMFWAETANEPIPADAQVQH